MLNPTALLARQVGQNLADVYRETFGDRDHLFATGLDEAARLILERIGSSDALYHDAHHTAMVALAAQDILRGVRFERSVSPSDWYHFMIAAAPPMPVTSLLLTMRETPSFRHGAPQMRS